MFLPRWNCGNYGDGRSEAKFGDFGCAFDWNEMRSYPELAEVPVAIISSVKMKDEMAEQYGVVKVYDKGELMPADVISLAEEYDGKESA